MPVYLLGVVDGCHKIGRSLNPEKRSEAWSMLPSNPSLVHVIETSNQNWLEKYLHHAFRKQRARGEWFCLGETELALIRAVASVNCEDELPEEIRARHRAPDRAPESSLPTKNAERLLTVNGAAEFLACHRKTVYALMERGELRWVMLGARRRVRYSDLLEFVAQLSRR